MLKMNFRNPTAMEMQPITDAQEAYRKMWSSLKCVPPCEFAGDRTDIEILDFIDYEINTYPLGISGAALIWGNVLAINSGILFWMIDERQQLVLMTSEDDWPRVMIDPIARVAEINNSSVPQFGKYEWLLEETVLRLWSQGFKDDTKQRFQSLLDIEPDGFINSSKQWIDSINQLNS
jgi:hypothetical protein